MTLSVVRSSRQKPSMQAKPETKDQIPEFLEDFVCAGSSALLISLAQLYPALWFVSFLALIPFLWRATRVSPFESLVLGALLATSYCLAATPIASMAKPGSFLFRFLFLNALFSCYAIAVNRIAGRFGFNALVIALSWLPVEYALSNHAHLGSIFTFSETDSTLLIRLGSLLGMLMVSFGVVLINSLILSVLERAVHATRSQAVFRTKHNTKTYPPFRQVAPERRRYHLVHPRAPPLVIDPPGTSFAGSESYGICQDVQKAQRPYERIHCTGSRSPHRNPNSVNLS